LLLFQLAMRKIKILLVDDHQIVRRGIKNLLKGEDEIEIIGEAESAEAVLEFLKIDVPDVILSDITLPGISGIDLMHVIKEQFPQIYVLMFSMHSEDEYIIDALNAGAKGYIPKVVDQLEIVRAIKEVSRGEMYYNNLVSGALARQIYSLRSKETTDKELSSRESEVLNLIVEGLNNKEIADKLIISKRTVDNHRANLMKKLGARNTADIVRIALNKGLISLK